MSRTFGVSMAAKANLATDLSTAAAAVLLSLTNYDSASRANCAPLLGTGAKPDPREPIVAVVWMKEVCNAVCVEPRVVWEPYANVMARALHGSPLHITAASDGFKFSIEPPVLKNFMAATLSTGIWASKSVHLCLFHCEADDTQEFCVCARKPSK